MKENQSEKPTNESHFQNSNFIKRETRSEAYQEHIKNVIEVGILQESRRPNSAQGSKKDNLRARYWSYLFDNLQRAVDEIYKTCDNDESTVECEVRFLTSNVLPSPLLYKIMSTLCIPITICETIYVAAVEAILFQNSMNSKVVRNNK